MQNELPTTIVLSKRDAEMLLELLDSDEEPNDALKEAYETHKKLIQENNEEIA